MSIIFKPILPKKFNDKALLETLSGEVEKYKPFLQRDFDNTVRNWTGEKPTFQIRYNRGYAEMSLSVAITGGLGKDKWYWLNDGTKAHVIRPRNARVLAFPEGKYNAGSAPGSLRVFSGSSSATGGFVYTKQVMHPGIQARNWLQLIAIAHEKPFTAWMTAALSAAVRASGHAM